jgi:hypothetical protein
MLMSSAENPAFINSSVAFSAADRDVNTAVTSVDTILYLLDRRRGSVRRTSLDELSTTTAP